MGIREPEQLAGDQGGNTYKNVGWSLGNACPMKCAQCYSRATRQSDASLTVPLIEKIIEELHQLGVETVNLGGNEPIFTNGLSSKKSLLPFILRELTARKIKVGITTAGPTLIELEKINPESLTRINDVDISIDSPKPEEHDANRGRRGIYNMAMKAVAISARYGIPMSFITCGMKWNFTEDRLTEMIRLAKRHGANFRVNPLKPIESEQHKMVLTPMQFYEGLRVILEQADPVDLSDPAWASSVGLSSESVAGCPCGVSSFRIHPMTPNGQIPISPCVYLHDFKYGDLAEMTLREMIESESFQAFRRRNREPEEIEGCEGCGHIETCRGGCAARSYLQGDPENPSIFTRDPYCFRDFSEGGGIAMPSVDSVMESTHALVHKGYLCTGIFVPR